MKYIFDYDAAMDGEAGIEAVRRELERQRGTGDAPRRKPHAPSSGELVGIATREYRLACDCETGRCFAVRDGIAIPLEGQDFAGLLSRSGMETCGRPASEKATKEAVNYLKTLARDRKIAIHHRIANAEDGSVWIDNVGEANRQIRLTGEGPELVDPGTAENAPVFTRSPYMKPLPEPSRTPSLKQFWRMVNIPREQQGLAMSWLVFALLHENRPFPLCLVEGEQGSAKSSTVRILLDLIDPSGVPLMGLPRDERELSAMSNNMWVLRFDNLSAMSAGWQDIFCRVSTGGGFATRKLYTDGEIMTFNIHRPVIMTTISAWNIKPDLAQRLLKINTPRIENDRRLSEEQLEREWQSCRSDAFSYLLDLAMQVKAMGSSGPEDGPSVRMADFGRVLSAIDRLYPETRCLESYMQQQNQLGSDATAEEPLITAMRGDASFFSDGWNGTSGELLAQFKSQIDEAVANTRKKAPSSAGDVTRILDRYAQALRDQGWGIEHTRGTGNKSGTREWTITAPADL